MMMVSRLLKSCASPPVSWPTASIFCACTSAAWLAFCSVMSVVMTKKPTTVRPSVPISGTTTLRACSVRPSVPTRLYS